MKLCFTTPRDMRPRCTTPSPALLNGVQRRLPRAISHRRAHADITWGGREAWLRDTPSRSSARARALLSRFVNVTKVGPGDVQRRDSIARRRRPRAGVWRSVKDADFVAVSTPAAWLLACLRDSLSTTYLWAAAGRSACVSQCISLCVGALMKWLVRQRS